MSVPYNTAALPQWDGSNAAPFSQEYRKGYDSTAPRLGDKRRAAALSRTNATLCDGATWLPLFVHDVDIDLALAGSTAQSRTTRDFYPRNFTQPSFIIAGQSLDQQDYGLLCEFMHQAQHTALSGGQLAQIFIHGWGYDGTRNSNLSVRRRSPLVGNRHHNNQIIRGGHETILAQGYVMAMPRRHQQSEYAPEWQFGFVVADMISGPYHEDMAVIRQQQTWVDMLKSIQTLPVNKALLQENKRNLAWAAANSVNVLNTGGGSSGSSGGTPTGTGKGGWQTVTATIFGPSAADAGGPPACGGSFSDDGGMLYAELGTAGANAGNPQLGPLFGFGHQELPCGFKLEVKNVANGKSAILVKKDRGSGAPGAAIDLWGGPAAIALGFQNIGKGPVQIRAA